jgi:hypothetical protein
MTTEQKTKVIEFISKEVTPEFLALTIRRYKEQTIRLVLQKEDDVYNKDWISEGHYWLTELCEILDPQLEKD